MTRKKEFLSDLDELIRKHNYNFVLRETGEDEHFVLDISLTEERPRSIAQLEAAAIERALFFQRWDIRKAAKLLGITGARLQKKIKAYDIKRKF